jgi:hypothetical protein
MRSHSGRADRAHLPAGAAHEALQWITASVGKETRLIMVDDVAYFQATASTPWS